MTACVQFSHTKSIHCCTQCVLITAVYLPQFYYWLQSGKSKWRWKWIENTTIKTKSNWNPDLSSSISIKRARAAYTKEGKAHMGILTIMIDICFKKKCVYRQYDSSSALGCCICVSTKAKVEDRHRHIQIFISLRLDVSYCWLPLRRWEIMDQSRVCSTHHIIKTRGIWFGRSPGFSKQLSECQNDIRACSPF